MSVEEIDKAKPGYSQKKCKFCTSIGHGKNPDELVKAFGQTCYKYEGSGHFANVCTVKKEDAKSNAMAAVEEKDESKAEFMSVKAGPHVRVNTIKQKDEISRVGNLDWDKELQHWVRRKPRGMAQMRVDIKVLVEDLKFWHPNKRLENYQGCIKFTDLYLIPRQKRVIEATEI